MQTPGALPWKGRDTGRPAILRQLLTEISSLEPREKRLRRWEVTPGGPEHGDILSFVILHIKPSLAGEPRSPTYAWVSGSAC